MPSQWPRTANLRSRAVLAQQAEPARDDAAPAVGADDQTRARTVSLVVAVRAGDADHGAARVAQQVVGARRLPHLDARRARARARSAASSTQPAHARSPGAAPLVVALERGAVGRGEAHAAERLRRERRARRRPRPVSRRAPGLGRDALAADLVARERAPRPAAARRARAGASSVAAAAPAGPPPTTSTSRTLSSRLPRDREQPVGKDAPDLDTPSGMPAAANAARSSRDA